MDTNYARGKLQLVLRDLEHYNDEELWRELSRIAYGSTTGQPNAEELLRERDELNAQCYRLRDVVFGELDIDRAMDILLEEPKQSLLFHDAMAIDRFRATITENLSISCQLEFIYESKNYTNQLREQAKEGVK
jgi:hypothetical protein